MERIIDDGLIELTFEDFLLSFKDFVKEQEFAGPILYNFTENYVIIRFKSVYDFICRISFPQMTGFYNSEDIKEAYEMFESEFLIRKGIRVSLLK